MSLNSHYVLSSHAGCYSPLVQRIRPPQYMQVIFYSDPGHVFAVDPVVQTNICKNPTQYERNIEEVAILPEQQPTFPSRRDIKTNGFSIDYELAPDDDPRNTFFSGIVCCTCKKVIFNIDTAGKIRLSDAFQIVKDHNTKLHTGTWSHLHFLACRSTEVGPSGETGLSKTGSKSVARGPDVPIPVSDKRSMFAHFAALEAAGQTVTIPDPNIAAEYALSKVSAPESSPEYIEGYTYFKHLGFDDQVATKGAQVYYTRIKTGASKEIALRAARAVAVFGQKDGGSKKKKTIKKKTRKVRK